MPRKVQTDQLSVYSDDIEDRETDIIEDVQDSRTMFSNQRKAINKLKKKNGINIDMRDYFDIKYVVLALLIFASMTSLFGDVVIDKLSLYLDGNMLKMAISSLVAFVFFIYNEFLT